MLPGQDTADRRSPHTVVDDAAGAFLAVEARRSPVASTRLGDHRRDHEVDDWGPDNADAWLRDLADVQRRLDELGDLGDAEADGDRLLVADAVAAQRFALEGRRDHATNPLLYLDLATGGVHELLRRDDLETGHRQAAVASRAAQVPRLLEQAAARLEDVPAPHRDVALQQAAGAAQFFRDVVPAFAPATAQVAEEAARSVERFAAGLQARAAGAAPDWRLGERWPDALRLALGVRMPAEEVRRRAEAAVEALHSRMEELAAVVLGARTNGLRGRELILAGLAACARDAAPREELVARAAGVLDDVVAFLRDDGIFPVPDPAVLRVEEVPAFQQGVAVAFFIPAPPLATGAAHTYFLSPVPASWDDERAESFLREYNLHALASVGIHEAWPGHYVQFALANAHPRLVRRALYNSAFVEGWAVYAEDVVVTERGYGSPQLALVSAKLALRGVANALLDQGLHVDGWDRERALELLVGQAFQEPAEAEGKIVRGRVTAGQLSSYFVGGEEMADLRRDVAAARGTAFDLRTFHDDVLAQASPPFPVLRRALLPRTSGAGSP